MIWLLACSPEPVVVETETEPPAPVEVRAEVDRAIATTGDLVTYRLEIEHAPGIEVQMPEYGAEIAGFRIVDLGTESTEEGGRIEQARWFQLRADLVGSYVLPSARLAWKPEGDDTAEWTVIQTSEIFVEVASVLPADGEATDLRDIKGLQPPEPVLPLAWIAAGVAAVAALALLGFTVWWRRRPGPPIPPPLPHEVAYAALDGLRARDLADVEAVRGWYFSLSQVLRAYVEGRFGLNATDLTSEEIGARLGELDALTAELRGRLEHFLSETDQVKYARHAPGDGEIEQSYEAALHFVEETAVVPEPVQS